MDRLIYTTLTGMRSLQAAQAVTANNLANADVTGFRRELSSLASRYLTGPGDSARVDADDAVTTVGTEPGRITATGQPLDVAIRGSGWIAVQADDGGEAYTRRGDLRVGATGVLETGEGLPVIGNAGPISVPPGTEVAVAPDGGVSVRLPGTPAPSTIDRIKLVDPPAGQLAKDEDGLFRSSAAVDAAPGVRLQTGALEGSNVDRTRMLVDLVEQSRGFDVNTKLLAAARDMDEGAARLMRLDN